MGFQFRSNINRIHGKNVFGQHIQFFRYTIFSNQPTMQYFVLVSFVRWELQTRQDTMITVSICFGFQWAKFSAILKLCDFFWTKLPSHQSGFLSFFELKSLFQPERLRLKSFCHNSHLRAISFSLEVVFNHKLRFLTVSVKKT